MEPSRALALALLLAPAAGGASPFRRFLPGDDALRPRPANGGAGRRLQHSTCGQEPLDSVVSDLTGTTHPYVYEVSGLGARVFLTGTIHISTKLLYGDDVPLEIAETLAAADAIYTEVDVHETCAPADEMGSPDCTASLSGIAPAARHFTDRERGRIAHLLATNPVWRDDLLSGLAGGRQNSSCTLPQWIEWLDRPEAAMRMVWESYPACREADADVTEPAVCVPNMPWRAVTEWSSFGGCCCWTMRVR